MYIYIEIPWSTLFIQCLLKHPNDFAGWVVHQLSPRFPSPFPSPTGTCIPNSSIAWVFAHHVCLISQTLHAWCCRHEKTRIRKIHGKNRVSLPTVGPSKDKSCRWPVHSLPLLVDVTLVTGCSWVITIAFFDAESHGSTSTSNDENLFLFIKDQAFHLIRRAK